MKRIRTTVFAAFLLALAPTPAKAAPVVAAIGTIVSSITTFVAALGPIGSLLFRIVVSVAASALLQALAPKPREPGIKTEVTQSGGTNPVSFILLKYATGGTRSCPPMSHGSAGKTPNAYLTEVIELGDIPGQTLSRVMMNDEFVTLGGSPHADYGLPVTGRYANAAWVKYYDGTQTAADPMMLAKYGTYPERPWLSDMIGRGLCYAIVTFKYERSLWGSTVPPRLRFEVNGIPLYDPRKDTTVGGSGAHRWADRTTWESTANPMVAIYNILRGIELETGDVWGAGIDAADLPLAAWFAAMNECDLAVGDGGAGTEAQYRAGFEVTVDEEPSDVIAELLKACSGQLAEIGGIWKPRVGPVGLPVFSFADGDIVISEEQTHTPFPGFTASFNGIHAIYPEPEMLWEQKEAPPLYNATWEAEDQGQRLIANLGLPSVPYGAQARRLMAAFIADERRFRRHGLTLPPDASVLEPLDAVAWTSASNGYAAKIFEMSEVVEDLHTGLVQIALRERDAADYVSSNPAPPDIVSVVPVFPDPQEVPDFAVSGTSIPDASGAARRPALLLEWEPDLEDVTGITWAVRVQATGVVVAQGTAQDVAAGQVVVSEGILASTDYEARALPVTDRAADWTAWLPATTPATLITSPDIAVGAVSDEVADTSAGGMFSTLPLNTVLALITLPNPSVPWVINATFDIRRTNGSGGTFNIVLEEYRSRAPINDVFRVLHTWTIMTDGEVGNIFDWWFRWHTVTRGGIFDDRAYRLRVSTKSGSPFGEIRSISLVATRVTK